MEKFEIKKLYDADEKVVEHLSEWLYNWWGKDENFNMDQMKSFVSHSMNKDKLPYTYVMSISKKIIGMFQIIYDDLSVRPDIYPWLANVYIDKEYRGNGYGRKLLEYSNNVINDLNIKDIYLYTPHNNLYEKFGWEFIGNIDTYTKIPRIQKLYKFIK